MSHTIYAAKFEQTIIHQHVHLWRESQSHEPAHVLMRLYPIDKSLVCLQSERRTSIFDKSDFFLRSHLHGQISNMAVITSIIRPGSGHDWKVMCFIHWLMKFQFQFQMSIFWPITWHFLIEMNYSKVKVEHFSLSKYFFWLCLIPIGWFS